METRGVDQASAEAPATGYPWWFWLVAALALGLLPVTTLLPNRWDIAAAAVLVVTLAAMITRIRESSSGVAMNGRDGVVLLGPAFVALLAGAVTSRFWWWAPIAAGVLVFALVASTGLLLERRAAR